MGREALNSNFLISIVRLAGFWRECHTHARRFFSTSNEALNASKTLCSVTDMKTRRNVIFLRSLRSTFFPANIFSKSWTTCPSISDGEHCVEIDPTVHNNLIVRYDVSSHSCLNQFSDSELWIDGFVFISTNCTGINFFLDESSSTIETSQLRRKDMM